ncbi:MAG: AAA family ATPase [Cyanobacteria bacterium P01_G01_bin.54]
MKLLRVQVPEFRALKNVDISFEPDFKPSIFPLASQNGGGKSTLLQLIFSLLNCATSKERFKYFRNLFSSIYESIEEKTFARIDILYEGDILSIEYKFLVASGITPKDEKKIRSLLHIRNDLEESYADFLVYVYFLEKELEKETDHGRHLANELDHRIHDSIFMRDDRFNFNTEKMIESYSALEHFISSTSKNYQGRKTEELKGKSSYDLFLVLKKNELKAKLISSEFEETFLRSGLSFLGQINSFDANQENLFMGYHISGSKKYKNDCNEVLERVREKIFLTIPETQICLLTAREARQSLFDNHEDFQYKREMRKLRQNMEEVFIPSFIPTKTILKEFEKSRDEDFKNAIKTGGNYGSNYTKLVQDIKKILVNKRIDLDPKATPPLSRIKVFLEEDDELKEIYPEDLSHGELKQLSLYMWLRHRNIKDAVVLMDEIEIALHPDWQYQIIKDLEEWGPTNQYILATHSYELCTALTPSHVKEIEPKLSTSRNHESE